MTGEFFKWVGFKIEGDFTTSPSLTDGYVDLKLLGPGLTRAFSSSPPSPRGATGTGGARTSGGSSGPPR